MRVNGWIPLGLLVGGVASAAPAAHGQEAYDAIPALNAAVMEMMAADDLDGIVGLYTDDARFMPSHAPLAYGPDAIRESWRLLLELPVLTLESETLLVAESGEQAVDIGRYHAELTGPDGDPVVDDGKYLVVWLRQDGEWRIFADIFNSDLPLE